MGSFYSSLLIPKIRPEEVKAVVTDWLERKGFEIEDKKPVLEIDDDNERGLILYANEQWTILLYSHFQEIERLYYELDRLKKPVLHFWLQHSDVWGYELYKDGSAVSAFNSNPNYFGTYEEPEAPNDLGILCNLCGFVGLEEVLEKIQKQKGVLFKERSCEKFTRALNAAPAASDFKYSEWSAIHQQSDGFSVAYLRFRKTGCDPLHGFDLHKIDAYARKVTANAERQYDHQDLEGLIDSSHLKRMIMLGNIIGLFFKLLFFLLWPIIKIARAMYWLRGKISKSNEGGIAEESMITWRLVGDDMINELHGCRITLLESAIAEQHPPYYSIDSVFDLKVDGFKIKCRAISDKHVKQLIVNRSNAVFLSDENWFVSNLPVKSVYLIAEVGLAKTYHEMHFVQTPRAVYTFDVISEDEVPLTLRNKIKTIVKTFRLED